MRLICSTCVFFVRVAPTLVQDARARTGGVPCRPFRAPRVITRRGTYGSGSPSGLTHGLETFLPPYEIVTQTRISMEPLSGLRVERARCSRDVSRATTPSNRSARWTLASKVYIFPFTSYVKGLNSFDQIPLIFDNSISTLKKKLIKFYFL